MGLRTVALGANAALTSAVANDTGMPDIGLAQELYALARPGDALLAITTSGRSSSVVKACQVARALALRSHAGAT